MKTYFATFERFEIELPREAIEACSHAGDCDDDVSYWAPKLNLDIDREKLAAELKEYGAWSAEELSDHEANLRRIIWIAAVNIKEDSEHEYTNEIEALEFTLPSHWACPLINADESGLEDEDIAELNGFLARNPGMYCVDVSEDSFFSHFNDADTLACDCSIFTFHLVK